METSKGEIQRIVIIGPSGSGKTTLGKNLSKKLNLPLCDLDDLAWLPNWQGRDPEETRVDVERIVAQDQWIIVGNYSRYRELTWYQADLILWIDLPLSTCLWRGFSRAVKNIWYHTPICNGNYDNWSRLFSFDNRSILYWIYTTHNSKCERYQRLLEEEKDPKLPPHQRFRSPKEVQDFINTPIVFEEY